MLLIIVVNKIQESYTFVPNKSFGQLLDILSENFTLLKTFDLEFSYIEVWFTDRNSNPLEIEYEINTLFINKKWLAIQFNQEI